MEATGQKEVFVYLAAVAVEATGQKEVLCDRVPVAVAVAVEAARMGVQN